MHVIPPNNKCAGPPYEIVLMLDTWLRRRARDSVEIAAGRLEIFAIGDAGDFPVKQAFLVFLQAPISPARSSPSTAAASGAAWTPA